jgi:superfamily I DNA/RNA helicase
VKWSDEQIAFKDAVCRGEACKLVAYAGTGKTSTVMFAAREDRRPGVCFVFNRAIAAEGQRRFMVDAPNVAVSTGHSYAMKAVGRFYSHRLQKSPWQLRAALREKYLRDLLKTSQSPGDADRMVFAIMDVIRAFEHSLSPEIDESHLPAEALSARVVNLFAPEILRIAREAWSDIEDRNGTLPVSHDSYFKIWALSEPKIDTDVIYYDETQDANAVMIAVLKAQTHAQLVLSGDSYQAIYGWRGAVNAMEQFDLATFPLTTSWRFGPEIAAVANLVLKARGAPWPLVGGAPAGKVSLKNETPPTCILTRTNAGLVDAALAEIGARRSVAILGGAEPVASMIEGAFELWLNGKSDHPSFRLFNGWAELDEASKSGHGGNLRATVKLVDRFTYGIPDLAARLRSETVDEQLADVILSTVHGFKGRGSPILRLGSDFSPFAAHVQKTPGSLPEAQILLEEANIAYVALTRAESELQIGSYIDVFKRSLEVARQILEADGSPQTALASPAVSDSPPARKTRRVTPSPIG